jgi:hypothetical protein
MTLGELTSAYGKRWTISSGIGGGFYAVRRHPLSAQSMARGLSAVRAGATLEELAGHLAAETRLEQHWLSSSPPAWPS